MAVGFIEDIICGACFQFQLEAAYADSEIMVSGIQISVWYIFVNILLEKR